MRGYGAAGGGFGVAVGFVLTGGGDGKRNINSGTRNDIGVPSGCGSSHRYTK